MGRFTNWTMADVEKLNPNLSKLDKTKNVQKRKSRGLDYVGMISNALTVLKVDHVLEYKFLHDRRFRFDIAIPKHHIAIEFEGGVFTNGRHTRGVGYVNDAKKYNLATMHGWKLLRFTTADTSKLNWEFRVANEIVELMPKGFCNER